MAAAERICALEERLRRMEERSMVDATKQNELLALLREKDRQIEMSETQKALAQKDLEILRLKEAGGGAIGSDDERIRTKMLELEAERSKDAVQSKEATIEALVLKNKLVHKELKECRAKLRAATKSGGEGGAAPQEEADNEDGVEKMTDVEHAEDIGQRRHARLGSKGRLFLLMWKAPKQMHPVHFNQCGAFVKAVSSTAVELEDDDDDEPFAPRRKKRAVVNKEWLGLVELETAMPFDAVEQHLKALGRNDMIVGPVFLESEQQLLVRPKTAAGLMNQRPRAQVKVSFLRR